MAYRFTLLPTSLTGTATTTYITNLRLDWDTADTPPSRTSLFQVVANMGVPSFIGNVEEPSSTPPVTYVPSFSEFSMTGVVIFTAATPGQGSLSIAIINSGITPVPAPLTFTWNTLAAQNFVIDAPTVDNNLLFVATNDTGTPAAGPNAKITTIARNPANNQPVANVPVRFSIASPTVTGFQVNLFNGATPITPPAAVNNQTTVTIMSGADGRATLTIVPTTRSFLVSCTVTGSSVSSQRQLVFIVDRTKINPSFSSPLPQLGTDQSGNFTLGTPSAPNFPVQLTATVPGTEVLGLILNDRLTGTLAGPQAGPTTLQAASGFLRTRLPQDRMGTNKNTLFYAVSQSGSLFVSPANEFDVVSNNGNILMPGDPFVGPPLVADSRGGTNNVQGGVINTVNFAFISVVIPLAADVPLLAARNRSVVAGNAIIVKANLKGLQGGKFATETKNVNPVAIVNPAAQTQTIRIPVSYLNDYGQSSVPGQSSMYQFWYTYVNSTTDQTLIAESFLENGGALATKAI